MAKRKEKYQPSKINVKLPKGYKIVSGNFAKVMQFDKKGDFIEGEVKQIRRGIKTKYGKQAAMEIQTKKGLFSVWESAALKGLFSEAKPKDSVYIRFDGLGEKKKGQSAIKLFTVGIK